MTVSYLQLPYFYPSSQIFSLFLVVECCILKSNVVTIGDLKQVGQISLWLQKIILIQTNLYLQKKRLKKIKEKRESTTEFRSAKRDDEEEDNSE
jgi:hypothetical protein